MKVLQIKVGGRKLFGRSRETSGECAMPFDNKARCVTDIS